MAKVIFTGLCILMRRYQEELRVALWTVLHFAGLCSMQSLLIAALDSITVNDES